MKRARVLLLGDSISLGYRNYVKNNLRDFCKVIYPLEQGKYASDIYRMLYEWKKDLEDVDEVKYIYWNAGLWDVVRVLGEGPQTDENVYRDYIKKTAIRLKKIYPNAKICFATTTPVLEERYGKDFFRLNSDIERYNLIAKEVLSSIVDCYDDLYGFMKDTQEEDYVDATHYGYYANVKLGKHIETVIRQSLNEYETKYRLSNKNYDSDNSELLTIIHEKRDFNAVCWGVGNILDEFINVIRLFCNVTYVVDRDKALWGAEIKGIQCLNMDEVIGKVQYVIITLDNVDSQEDIKEWCRERFIFCFTYQEVLEKLWIKYETEQLLTTTDEMIDADPNGNYKMAKYIGIDIPDNYCNFDCKYCYLALDPNRRIVNIHRKNPHDPRYIRQRLSRKKLGGSCLIGITASGETMFADEINDVCLELLKEGHFLHIVTNGTYYNGIRDLLVRSNEYSKHIMFKLSFHYIELKRRGLLQKFVEVVNLIEESKASYTIELMPYDELIPYIDEIKNFSQLQFGAYPHVTIGRDEKRGARLLSNYSFGEYMDIWKVFDSEMLDMRSKLYMIKGRKCEAGPLAFFVNLYSGTMRHCLYNENLGNIFIDDFSDIDLSRVGDTCPLPYCFNCHVYATMGILPIENVPTYYAIRDRVRKDGRHWIKKEMREYLNVKFCKVDESEKS